MSPQTEVLLDSSPKYLASDQPETCRWCGARTDFIELTASLQHHNCLNCQRQYYVEIED
jgi:hypothetical protein